MISAVSWLAFLPSGFWDKVFSWLKTSKRLATKIYYDGECGFCRKSVLLIKTFWLLPETAVLKAEEDPKISALMEKHHSWVVVDQTGKAHVKFDAWIHLCSVSPLLWPLAALLRLKPIHWLGEKVYQFISHRRGLGGRFLKLLKYRPLKWRSAYWIQVVVAFSLVYVFMWNVRTLNFKYFVKNFSPRLEPLRSSLTPGSKVEHVFTQAFDRRWLVCDSRHLRGRDRGRSLPRW